MTCSHFEPITAASQEVGKGGVRPQGTRTSVVGGACGAPGPGAEPEFGHLDGFSETAVNIGFACKLLSENMLILEDKDIK